MAAALGIGERLRNAREARGLSLDEIEAATRIRRRFLEALEAEAFDQLPGTAYAKGFLRTYASYLGLRAEDLAGISPEFRAGPIVTQGSPVEVRITPVTPQSRARRIITGIAVLIAIGGVFLGFMLYGQLRQFAVTPLPSTGGPPSQAPSSPRPAPHAGGPAGGAAQGVQPAGPQGGRPTGSPAGQPAPKPPVSPTTPPGTPSTPPATPAHQPAVPSGAPAQPAGQPAAGAPGTLAGPLSIVVVATDRSWVRTVADGVTVYEGFLSPGDRQGWQANHQLTLKVGNAGAVEVTVNGRPLGRLGNPGDVVDRTFTAGTPAP